MFTHDELSSECSSYDDHEVDIFVKIKDHEINVSNLSAVNLVEKLKEDECVVKHCHVFLL